MPPLIQISACTSSLPPLSQQWEERQAPQFNLQKKYDRETSVFLFHSTS